LMHAALAVAWFGPAQLWQAWGTHEQPTTVAPKRTPGSKFVAEKTDEKPATPPAAEPKSVAATKPEPSPVEKPIPIAEPARREYAGELADAPTPAKESPPPAGDTTVPRPEPPPVVAPGVRPSESSSASAVTSAPLQERKRLMAAEETRANGDPVPIIDAVGLTSDDIDDIVHAGAGVLVVECKSEEAGRGPQRYLVQGPIGSPTRLVPVTGNDLRGYSERALPIPPVDCLPVRKQLKADFAIGDKELSECRYLLLFTNGFDQKIYAVQCRAAADMGAKLDELAVTTGRFEPTGGDVAFRVTEITRHDGMRFDVHSGGR
jgi:hypothetical protein